MKIGTLFSSLSRSTPETSFFLDTCVGHGGSRVEKADRTLKLRQLEVEGEYLRGRKNTKSAGQASGLCSHRHTYVSRVHTARDKAEPVTEVLLFQGGPQSWTVAPDT